MSSKRSLSTVMGIKLGCVIGFYIFWIIGVFLADCLTEKALTEPEMINFFKDCAIYGILPGAIVGCIIGTFVPSLWVLGLMTRVIGIITFFIVAPLTWYSQWDKVTNVVNDNMTIAIVLTIMVLGTIFPLCVFIETRIEETKEKIIGE